MFDRKLSHSRAAHLCPQPALSSPLWAGFACPEADIMAADPAQRRTLDEIEHETAATAAPTTMTELDDKIAEDGSLLFSAYFEGHPDLADFYVIELRRLRNLRFMWQCERDREAP